MEPTGPNAEQIRTWNEQSGPRWVARQALMDAQLAAFGEAPMDALSLREGESVLDVGCGAGASSLALARRVGASGSVLGVDVSEPLLARARERVIEEALGDRVRFENADAQTHAFPSERYDALYSRFGVMFFADPRAAFANLARALKPGGRVAFVCWQHPSRNPWVSIPLEVAGRHITPPPAFPTPGAPGPFGLADDALVRDVLAAAGLRDVSVDALELPMGIGAGTLEEAVEHSVTMGPCSAALRASPEALEPVKAGLREALAPFVRDDGVYLPSAAWVVRARK